MKSVAASGSVSHACPQMHINYFDRLKKKKKKTVGALVTHAFRQN